jgi:DNA-binding CsgD family transcriptional regulator/PAS domain-containing protein
MNPETQEIYAEYQQLMRLQQFDEASLDYSTLDDHKRFLARLAEVENSAVSVFDMHLQKHVFASWNFTTILGYEEDGIHEPTNDFFDSKVHPEDMAKMMRNGVYALRYLYSLPLAERKHNKFVCEFRVRNGAGRYIRVIEQQQALAFDSRDNIWLSLSVLDISPTQDGVPDVTGRVVNFKTGNVTVLETMPKKTTDSIQSLTPRQVQILEMVKDGLLSKEISDRLSISVHTVNTHRQRILAKLSADNSIEAIRYAAGLGLVPAK